MFTSGTHWRSSHLSLGACTVVCALLVLSSGASFAKGGGASGQHGNFGGKSASHISAMGRANTNGPNAANRSFGLDRAHQRMSAQGLAHSKATGKVKKKGGVVPANFGGKSASHISANGLANTNGPNAANRSFGLDRAHQRMSAQGLAHSKATSSKGHTENSPADAPN